MNQFFKVDEKLKQLAAESESECYNIFKKIEQTELYNESKTLKAFIDNKVSSSHFIETTGYGYGDSGKEIIDNVFKQIFNAEDALVRCSFVSGTHAISVALFALLKPADTILSITGTPYDTVQQIIGINKLSKNNDQNLKTYGINYDQIELTKDDDFDFYEIKLKLKEKVKLIYIQRSKGYCTRRSVTIDKIEKLVKFVKKLSPKTVILVDNCYGEFVEKKEPTEVGADLICGSLIKNPGGAIASSGGYIAGTKKLIENCANTLTAPGLGKEVGCNFNQNRNILMGIFVAAHVVANALKVSAFTRAIFKKIGLDVFPKPNEKTSDIVSVIKLKNEKTLLSFCHGIQNNSPIDSFLTPQAWSMPGYEHKIVMASGSFTNGSSIEISADAPLKPPFNAFLQGGLTYNTGKICILNTIQKLVNEKLIELEN